MKKVIVVGGGIGGLASACLLAKDGFSVTLIEKNKILGGRARRLKLEDFYFDMGPSWYMMPEVFEDFFEKFGKKVSDFYQLKKLNISYRVFFNDGKLIDIYSDLKKNLQTFKKEEDNGDIKLKKYLKEAEFIYKLSTKKLVFNDYKNPFSLIEKEIILNIFKFDLLRSFHDLIKNKFKNQYLQKILEFTTVFLGGSPYNTPAFYKLISYADFILGTYYPIGGIYEVIKALEKIAKNHGVLIRTNEEVKKVEIINNKITKLKTNKSNYLADIVVVNADYQFFETKIIPKKYQTYGENYWKKRTMSPGVFLIYFGIKDNLSNFYHHNLYFDLSWEKHFNEVFSEKKLPENPNFYFHIPSKTDKNMAPPDCHSVMILAPIAPGLILNNNQKQNFKEKLLNKFAEIGKIKDIKKKIVVEKIFTIDDFEKDYNAFQGAAFGLAHTLFQTAIFRPKNFSQKLKNLYYVGQYTNPGVGMPPALISAQIVENLILKNEKNIRRNN